MPSVDILPLVYQEIGALLILSAEAVEELSKDQVSVEVVQYKTKDFLRSLEVSCQPSLACLQLLNVQVFPTLAIK